MTETRKCPCCGEEILATAKKCKYCKEWIENPSNGNSDEAMPNNHPVKETPVENDNDTNAYYLIKQPSFLQCLPLCWEKMFDYKTRTPRNVAWKITCWYFIFILGFILLFGSPLAMTNVLSLSYSWTYYNSDSIIGIIRLCMLVIIFYGLMLSIFISSISLAIRRLHDIGHSGLWLLIIPLPLFSIIMLIPSRNTDNEWGPCPIYRKTYKN